MIKYCKFLKLLSLITLFMLTQGCKFGDDHEVKVDHKKVAEELFQSDFKNLTEEKLNTYTKKEVNDELAKMDNENKYFNNLLNNPSKHTAMLMMAYLGSCEKQKVEQLMGDAVKHLRSLDKAAADKALMLGAMFNFGADCKDLAPDMLTRAMEMVAEENSDKFYGSLDDNHKKEWTKFMIENFNKPMSALAFKTVYKNCGDGDKKHLRNQLLAKLYNEKDHEFIRDFEQYGVTLEDQFEIDGHKGSLLHVLLAKVMKKDGNPEGLKATVTIFKEKLGEKYEGQVSDEIIDMVSENEPVPGMALHRLNCPSKVKPEDVMNCAGALTDNNLKKEGSMEVLNWLFASAITDEEKASSLKNIKISEGFIILSEAIMQFGTKAHMDLLWDAVTNEHIAYVAIALKDKVFINDGNTIMPAYFQGYYVRQEKGVQGVLKNILALRALNEKVVDIINKDYLPLDDLKAQDFAIDNKGNKGTILHSLVVWGDLIEEQVKLLAQALKAKGGFSVVEWQAYNKALLDLGYKKEWLLIE